MSEDPILEHVIVRKDIDRITRLKNFFRRNKFELALGALLSASMGLNGFLLSKQVHVCAYDLSHDDIDHLNRLLEEERDREKQ